MAPASPNGRLPPVARGARRPHSGGLSSDAVLCRLTCFRTRAAASETLRLICLHLKTELKNKINDRHQGEDEQRLW